MFASLEDLSLISAINEAGSVRAAADRMTLTPAAASKRLSALEDKMGLRIFNRTTRRLSPTAEGERLLAHAEAILAAVAEAEDDLSGRGGTLSGSLRLTASATFGSLFLIPAIAAFLERHPTLHVSLDLTDGIVDLTAEGIDLALRHGALPDSRLVASRLVASRRLVCATPGYLERHGRPEHPNDLVGHRCLPLGPELRWALTQDRHTVTVPVKGPFTCTMGEGLRQMTLTGAGVALLTDWLVCRDLAEGRLVSVLEDWRVEPEHALYAVYPSRVHLPRKTRAFIDHLRASWTPTPPWAL